MSKSIYYDGNRLLSMMDINGNRPEIYMSTSNRSAGKTTFFNAFVTRKFLKGEGKFAVLYRFNYELDDCANKFFKDVSTLFFGGSQMTSQRRARGIYHELFIDTEPCGYAIALNNADQIKRYSHLFSDVNRMVFDEFQSETNHYCNDEVKKFISVHNSIARGQGKQSRYVPVYMMSNPVTIINPYYVSLGISERLRGDTRFLRGNGFVLEQGFNEAASKAQSDSAFNQAFEREEYIAYASQAVYLNDNENFVEKPKGEGRYLATIKYKGNEYGLREYIEEGCIYCDNRPDRSYPLKISVTRDDHSVNYVMLKRNDNFLTTLRWYFDRGCFRFKDLLCKEALMKAISY